MFDAQPQLGKGVSGSTEQCTGSAQAGTGNAFRHTFHGPSEQVEIFRWRTTIQLGADEMRRAVKGRRKFCPGVKLPLIPLVSPTQRSSSRTGLDHFTAALKCSSAIHNDAAVVHLSSQDPISTGLHKPST